MLKILPFFLVLHHLASSLSIKHNQQKQLLVPTTKNAIAVLSSPEPSITGTIYFSQQNSAASVRIAISIQGLQANKKLGYHIHEYGDLSNGCESAGAHYNPQEVAHAGPNDKIRHVGDLGNLQTDHNGSVNVCILDNVIALFGEASIYGRAIVIHSGQDDLGKGSDPTSKTNGNSGARIACGAIGVSSKFVCSAQ